MFDRDNLFICRRLLLSIALLVFFLAAAPSTFAQSSPPERPLAPQVRFETFEVIDGLAHNMTNHVIRDRHGFLWVATINGLSRYDGNQFTTYRIEESDDIPLGYNAIEHIYEDESGLLWLTSRSGVMLFDPTTETFSQLLFDNLVTPTGQPVGRAALEFFSTFIDSRGTVWLGGSIRTGLVRYDRATDQAVLYRPPPPGVEQPLNGFNGGSIREFAEAADGRIWMTSITGLIVYDPVTDLFETFKPPTRATKVETLLYDDQGRLWIGSSEGLLRFDIASETFDFTDLQGHDLRVLHLDERGILWYIQPTRGLVEYNTVTDSIKQAHRSQLETPELSARGTIHAAAVDGTGAIWFATTNGVSVYAPRQEQFSWYGFDATTVNSLGSGNVGAVAPSADGSLWVGTPGMLNRVDFDGRTVERFPIYDEALRNISRILEDSQGEVWVVINKSLFWLDRATGEVVPSQFDEMITTLDVGSAVDSATPQTVLAQQNSALLVANPVGTIHGILEDADGVIWLAIFGRGLVKISADRELLERVPVGTPREYPYPSDASGPLVFGLTPARDGGFWVRYEAAGVSKYDPQTEQFTHYSFVEVNGLPASNYRVNGLYEDVSGNLWIATERGLYRFDVQLEAGERIEGLQNNFFASIAADLGGNLWLGSYNGLLRLRLSDQKVTAYGLDDGLSSVSFSPSAAFTGADGQLYFGTGDGITTFYPEQIRDEAPPPKPIVADIQLFNETISISDASDTILSTSAWSAESITLGHAENVLTFEFAIPGLGRPDLRYRYRLNGLDEMWNEVPAERRFVTYAQLAPGNYTLEVQSGLAGDVWNEEGHLLAVTITPAWWQRLSVQLAAALALVALIGAVFWRRNAVLASRNQELAREVDIRTRDLADSEARFRGIAAASFEAILLHDNGLIIDANRMAADLFGRSHNELIGQQLIDVIQDASAEELLTSDETVHEFETLTSKGDPLWLEARSRNVPYRDQQARVVALRDITERREMEAQQRRVATLEERERIGRDLHDDLGQLMGYISLQAQTVSEQVTAGQDEAVSQNLARLRDVAHEAHNNIRRFILGVREDDDELDEISLADALEIVVDRMRERHGLDVLLSLPPSVSNLDLSSEVEAQLLRIVQEALINIVKHAETDRAHLLMTLDANLVQIVIADSGNGFDPAQSAAGHYGLLIMRERAESVGGAVDIQSTVGSGTQVMVRMPRRRQIASAAALANARLMIVDDHPIYREGLRNLLGTRGLSVVGVAADGIEAEEKALTLKPDLILMDVEMPRRDGLDTVQVLHPQLPDTKIVMLTMAADDDKLLTALRNGASGYLLKSLEGERFFAALGEVMSGQTVLSPAMAAQLLTDVAKGNHSARADQNAPHLQLTERQIEVLRLVACKYSNKQIAAELFVSVNTVKFHVGKILERLQLGNRRELADYAEQYGLTAAD